MIDNFKVPNDDDYSYDDYGSGEVLDAIYLAATMATRSLKLRYPSSASNLETGRQRGCGVLTGPEMETVMSEIELLTV